MLHSFLPPRYIISCIVFLSFLLYGTSGTAQAIPAAQGGGTVSENGTGPAGIIPANHGLNTSLIVATQHDSDNGWSSILTPGIAWRLNPAFSVNASVPVYAYVNVLENTGTKTSPIYVQQTQHGVVGDTAISVTFELHPEVLSYSTTFTFGIPSGDTNYGLGAGRVGYNFNNRFEKDLGILTPSLEAGIANASNLIATRVHKSYTAAGALVHFQAGASIDLPHGVSFEADGYEEMPISAATIYSTTDRGKKKATTATTSSSAEDNGLTLSLDVPLSGHLTFSGFYDHSIRSQYDVAGFSMTLLLKPSPRHEGAF